ncbi:hypothetical protein [Massilia sp. TWP1-3-3]|uniref:hypothetical protein n=1 Tax=Massilia sp. TWP1-3-3 TaxID=2804573 RepID=UPI003CFB4DB9
MAVLSDKLVELCEFLRVSGGPTTWRGIKIFEVDSNYDDYGRPRVSGDRLLSQEEYSARFDELLTCGLPWINLSCFGIYDGFLVVGVEASNPSATLISNTSINYSGLPTSVLSPRWDSSSALVIECREG